MIFRAPFLLGLVLILPTARAAGHAPLPSPRPFVLSVTVDFPDDIRDGPYDTARIDAMMAAIRHLGARRVNWLYYGGTDASDPGRGNIWDSYWATYGPPTVGNLGQPLRAAVKSAHAHGLEIWGVLKPYNGGVSGSFPAGSQAAASRSSLRKIGGPLQQVIPFLEAHPEMRLQREWPAEPGAVVGPIEEIRLFKENAGETRLRPESIRLWVSSDNYRYRPLPIVPRGAVSLTPAPRDVRDYYGSLLTPAGRNVRTVRLTGLHLTDRYVVLTTTFADGAGDFRNTPLGMVQVFGPGGRPLAFVLATHAAVWIQPRDFRTYGLEYDMGYGHLPIVLDAPWKGLADPTRHLAQADEFAQDALFGRGPAGGFVGIALGRNAYLPAAPCEAYPEVRELWLHWIRQMLEAGVDGVDLRISAHGTLSDEPEAYGYNPPVLEAYRRRFASGPVTRERLAAVRGDIYTDFIREASHLVRSQGRKFRVHLEAEAFRPAPSFGQLSGIPANIDFQWRRWIEEGLIDEAYLRTSWFEATEDPLGKGPTQRSRLALALADPMAADMLAVANAHHVPVTLNRYIGRAAGLTEYLGDVDAAARDPRLAGFDIYEFNGLAVADPVRPGLAPVDDRLDALRRRWEEVRLAGIRLVKVPGGLRVGATKVTQDQYLAVTGRHPSSFYGDGRLPVERVTWYEAAHFCNLLSDRSGLDRCYDEATWTSDPRKNGFRLPTAAEAERYSRAGTRTRYFFGDDPARLSEYAWYGNTGSGDSDDLIRPVGLKRPNPWGLYDVLGDVWEWCDDRAGAPDLRVIRGGSFVSDPEFLQSDRREAYPARLSYLDIGFRIVSGPEDPAPAQSGAVAAAPTRALRLLRIPGGSFFMGAEDPDALWDEKPRHRVEIAPFLIGETEVTQEQYRAVTGKRPAHFYGFPNLPVESVSWFDAARFCNRLSAREGLEPCYDEATWRCDFSRDGYRLPTEAEYEYAARAGTTTINWSGDRYEDFDRVAWFQGNSGSRPHPVAGKPANPFGLYDAQGNIWEWTNDWYRWDYYAMSPASNPHGPDYGTGKVARGGRYFSWIRHARITRRSAVPVDTVSDGYGFRVARNAPP